MTSRLLFLFKHVVHYSLNPYMMTICDAALRSLLFCMLTDKDILAIKNVKLLYMIQLNCSVLFFIK